MGTRPRRLAAWPARAAVTAVVMATAGCGTASREAGPDRSLPATPTTFTAATMTSRGTEASPATAGTEPMAATVAEGTSSSLTTIAVPAEVEAFEADRDYQTVPAPVAVEIPAIGVASDLQELHRSADGTIEVPDWHHAGWWADGPKPGQPGPAVILGHVDTRDGPDVFYRLHELQAGDEVVVTRVDGSVARFIVQRVERHPKDAFPTEAVYAPSLEAGLRLVTCGGEFDRASGHYLDNVIAFATLAD